MTFAGLVSTFVGGGLVGMALAGFVDGVGIVARFDRPRYLAIDSDGILYVSDTGNNAIRMVTPLGLFRRNCLWFLSYNITYNIFLKISLSGIVSTLVGQAGPGFVDGSSPMIRSPFGLAISSSSLLLVADADNNAIRMLAPFGAYECSYPHGYYT